MDEMDFKTKFKISGQVLQNLFEGGNSPLSEHFLRWKLWSKWRDLMGTSIADMSEPVGYSDKKLYVYVKNPTMMHHMYFLKNNMVRKIQKDFHPHFINDIVFTLDRKKVPSSEIEKDKIKDSLSSILNKDRD
ncbi:MAG: DUF721 domain-containing protein [Bdellovibrionaceae bacterium]|nr:DUF721 domain-containing protein [Pseudobdellovibrionaceae bacterium]